MSRAGDLQSLLRFANLRLGELDQLLQRGRAADLNKGRWEVARTASVGEA